MKKLTRKSLKNNLYTKKADQAVDILMEGYMCSESVAMAFAEDFGLDPFLAARMSSGFAGGMAQGKICGAVTGSVMVIGLKYGSGIVKDQYSRDVCSQITQEFFNSYVNRRNTVECKQILIMNGVNPGNQEEMKYLREKKICDKIVRDAVEILDEIFQEEVE